jgi:leucyl/phenylalanyl-tRNA--protein transferase
MAITKHQIEFPDPWTTETIDDVIVVGGVMTPENLIRSYKLGIFPWPHEGCPLLWFCPEERGVLDFNELHISSSLKKWIKKNSPHISVTVNQNFPLVIKECRKQKRPDQKGSWINGAIEKNYSELQKMGFALSIECWTNDEMISGIYGVQSKQYFSCESMFFKVPNASKYAFIKLVEHLQNMGQTWMDLQMVTDVSGSFGGKYISKDEFLDRIECPDLKKTIDESQH